MKKLIFAGILCIAVAAGAYYMFLKERPADNLAVANVSNSSMTAQQTEATRASEIISADDNSYDENDIKIYEMGDIVSTCDFNYIINSVTKTKELGEYTKEQVEYFNGEEVDENGTLISDHSYIFINMTIENTSNAPIERTINSCGIIAGNDSIALGYTEEMRFFDKGLDAKSRDYFHYTLEENKKQTFNVGFIVKDENLDSNKLTMIINNHGTYPYDEAVRYILLHY